MHLGGVPVIRYPVGRCASSASTRAIAITDGRQEGTVEHYQWMLGVDWGGGEHVVCVMGDDGAVVGTRAVAHTRAAVHEAIAWVTATTGSPRSAIAVAIETPRGILVDTLIEQGFAVFAINPKQLDRFRDRFSVGGAKDDPRDARVLADALRTDRRAFRPVQPDDPRIIYLRELCRIEEELQEAVTRLANRLREQLYRVDAAWLQLCPAADDAWLWALLRDTPHPDQWPHLSRTRVARVLKTHRIRRLTVGDIITVVRQTRLMAAPGVTAAVATRIGSLVPQLLLIDQQRTTTGHQIDHSLDGLAAPRRGNRASIVTSSFSAPCQASEEPWPPRCSLKRLAHWPSAIIPRCVHMPAPRRLRSAAVNAHVPSTCATPANCASATRCSIGPAPAFSTTPRPVRTMIGFARVVIITAVRCGVSRIDGSAF